MSGVNSETLRQAIRNVPGFPKAGITFRDITPVLSDHLLFSYVIDRLAAEAAKYRPAKIVGIDARGFLFGAAVAYQMHLGFVPVRKKGKLPFQTVSVRYELEYASGEVEMHADGIRDGENVVLVDDLLATGGTSSAASALVEKLGGKVAASLFFIELTHLHGRDHLRHGEVFSLVEYHNDDC